MSQATEVFVRADQCASCLAGTSREGHDWCRLEDTDHLTLLFGSKPRTKGEHRDWQLRTSMLSLLLVDAHIAEGLPAMATEHGTFTHCGIQIAQSHRQGHGCGLLTLVHMVCGSSGTCGSDFSS